jgi:hypothetical protein
VTEKTTERFAKDNSETVPDFEDLLDYLDLGEEIQAIRTLTHCSPHRCASNREAQVPMRRLGGGIVLARAVFV